SPALSPSPRRRRQAGRARDPGRARQPALPARLTGRDRPRPTRPGHRVRTSPLPLPGPPRPLRHADPPERGVRIRALASGHHRRPADGLVAGVPCPSVAPPSGLPLVRGDARGRGAAQLPRRPHRLDTVVASAGRAVEAGLGPPRQRDAREVVDSPTTLTTRPRLRHRPWLSHRHWY